MDETYTSGTWTLAPDKVDAFVEAWREFAAWASARPGAGTLRLACDLQDPARFVSFGRWEDIAAVRAWKADPEFSERMGRVRRHVDGFEPSELEVVASATAGATTPERAPAG